MVLILEYATDLLLHGSVILEPSWTQSWLDLLKVTQMSWGVDPDNLQSPLLSAVL